MENPFRKCFFCGGDVDAITIGNFDYRLEGKLYVIKNTPAGLCLQCGEKYVTANTAKKINALIEAGGFSGTETVRVMEYT
jgi:YgiT-type zinc finger domain-containing protein